VEKDDRRKLADPVSPGRWPSNEGADDGIGIVGFNVPLDTL